MLDLSRALSADGIAVLQIPLEGEGRDLIALLIDYPTAGFYFARFSDETVSVDTPWGEACCFGKYGYGGAYFIIGEDGRVRLYSPEAENAWERPLVFANSSLTLFVQTYCRLMAAVFRLKAGFAGKGGLHEGGDAAARDLNRWLEQADPGAAAEGAFWPLPLYELADGFFPLMGNPVSRHIGMPEHRYLENGRPSEKT
ncbi:MAG: SUKH-4 family immunity protein [Neisseria sp.]|nr:SUKH-4 family immunity protein [Neisseria sp.]